MLSDIDTQQAQIELDQVTFDRYAALVKEPNASMRPINRPWRWRTAAKHSAKRF
jgi:hypothetical protein